VNKYRFFDAKLCVSFGARVFIRDSRIRDSRLRFLNCDFETAFQSELHFFQTALHCIVQKNIQKKYGLTYELWIERDPGEIHAAATERTAKKEVLRKGYQTPPGHATILALNAGE
jgi:hypothetical protein